mmetsp:Transcript_10382/g.13560  ORF Transcript_10382/g.13560 Transcript_10382/m.13560 type:complete len:147 (+) Transcript_10382:240-680(+)
MFIASVEKLELLKIAIENDEFNDHINDLDQEKEEEASLTVNTIADVDVECYNDAVEPNSTAAKVRASRRKKRRVLAQQLKQQATEERKKGVQARNLERIKFLKRSRVDGQWETRKKSTFSGLGYQATESRIEASNDVVSACLPDWC